MNPSTPGNPPMPFDGKRMIFGGFEPVVEVKAERQATSVTDRAPEAPRSAAQSAGG